MWVNEYLYQEHGEARANAIIEDIDQQYAFISFLRSSFNVDFVMIHSQH